MSNKGGRPRKYKSPEEFDAKVNEYVEQCRRDEEPMTWTGLALYLGFCCRADIDNYLKYDGFSYSVKRAKALVECSYEKRLSQGNPTGAIFALKNFGWTDSQHVNMDVKQDVVHHLSMAELMQIAAQARNREVLDISVELEPLPEEIAALPPGP